MRSPFAGRKLVASEVSRVCLVGPLIGVLVLATLAACAQQGCHSGADSPEEAVVGLIGGSKAADDLDDVCRFVSEGFLPTETDLASLKEAYRPYAVADLRAAMSSQMGADATVVVETKDGKVHDTFFVTSDTHIKWTVNFGPLDE